MIYGKLKKMLAQLPTQYVILHIKQLPIAIGTSVVANIYNWKFVSGTINSQ